MEPARQHKLREFLRFLACVVLLAALVSFVATCGRQYGEEDGLAYATDWRGAEVTEVVALPQAVVPETDAAPPETDLDGVGEGLEEEPDETLASEEPAVADIHLKIPAVLGNRRVRSVGPQAFWGKTMLRSVKFPRHVREIGNGAFSGCTKLGWAEWPSHLRRIGDDAFSNCIHLEAAELPDRLERIGARAFFG